MLVVQCISKASLCVRSAPPRLYPTQRRNVCGSQARATCLPPDPHQQLNVCARCAAKVAVRACSPPLTFHSLLIKENCQWSSPVCVFTLSVCGQAFPDPLVCVSVSVCVCVCLPVCVCARRRALP
ncbi:hypothetical protein AVEN_37919-1 [Araneus ventricosus]|uniref:Uncharacterized protein n=1 Tax=Araneus ventricosus TaxID=182803 RepID=A0A4Y2MZX9_ARAVE|nr:hypothetical protein AVEN_37919-1 [Araneus ventricosus]